MGPPDCGGGKAGSHAPRLRCGRSLRFLQRSAPPREAGEGDVTMGEQHEVDRGTPAALRADRPHPARVYDYLLGGKDNFAADREAAHNGLRANPDSRIPPRENRLFLRRAVRFLAEQGIDQFLDIGTGIPSAPNVHHVAQAVNPGSRIVYVDNDPIVLVHARALLTSHPSGRTDYIDADLRDVETILRSKALTDTLDLNRPVGLL